MEGNIFAHKKADQAFEDINSGASSLQITEVRARTEPGSYDNSATLQFDFGNSVDRYVLLSESYFQIKFKCGRVVKTTGNPAAPTGLVAVPDLVRADDGGDGTGGDIAIGLENRFFNHCVSNIRHSINGVQVVGCPEPATAANLRDLNMTKQYEQTAAGAFYAAKDPKALVGTTGADHTGEAAYRPPLGLWDITTPIGGASHSIVFDLKNHASYCAAVWDVHETTATAHAKQADDFSTTVAQATAAATFTTAREKYIFGIQEIVLRLATVAPQSMAMPGPSLLLEPREIDIARIDAGASASINKSAQVPGSTYKLDVMFPGLEPNGIDTSIAKPLSKDTTRLTSLFVTCAGQQIQQPQYQGLMERPCPIRPYTDFLVCQGSLTSTAEVVTPTLKEYSAAPHYLARVVQTPTNAQKEVVVRTQHDGAAVAKTLLLASWHTPAIAMFYDASGLVNQVAVNV